MATIQTKYKGLSHYSMAVFFIGSLLCVSCGKKLPVAHSVGTPQRIISLAPSITEILFALDCGKQVVGVTDFCIYPPEARQITRVGSFMDPNFEAIISAKPDLVIYLNADSRICGFLSSVNIKGCSVDNHNISAIIESILLVGVSCNRQDQALALKKSITDALEAASDSTTGITSQYRPKILLCVGRDDVGSGTLSVVWAAGATSYYDELIRAAGGVNVVTDSSMVYSTFSSEGIIRLKPDIIIDVMTNMYKFSLDDIKKDWQKLVMVPAVANDMVFWLSGDYVTIPGPRIILLLDDFVRIVKKYHELHISTECVKR